MTGLYRNSAGLCPRSRGERCDHHPAREVRGTGARCRRIRAATHEGRGSRIPRAGVDGGPRRSVRYRAVHRHSPKTFQRGSKLSWVKLDDQFFLNPKVIAAGHDAVILYLAGLTYAAGQLTDGKITAAALQALAGLTGTDSGLAARLVDVGLWEQCEDDYLIHDYLKYNPSAEQVERRREQTAARVAAWHRERGDRNGVSNAVRNAPPVPVPVPVPTEIAIERQKIHAAPDGAEPATEPPPKPARPRDSEAAYSPDFEAFWTAYPLHVEKHPAWLQWLKRLKDGVPAEKMIAAAEHFAAFVEREGREDRHIKHAATFLGPSRAYLSYIEGMPRVEHASALRANGPRASPSERPSKFGAVDTVVSAMDRRTE